LKKRESEIRAATSGELQSGLQRHEEPSRKMRRMATPAEVADYLRVPVKTLYQWRYRGSGPRAYRVGRHLRYRWEDVEAWLASRAGERTR
jgi:excisionase family DNA binding protein